MSDVSATLKSWLSKLTTLRAVIVQCGAIFLISILWQQRWGTIVDTSWLITESERFLAGERLYIDLLENNPPFTIWLFLPAMLTSHWIGISPEVAIDLYTWLAVIVGLALATVIIWKADFVEGRALLRQLPLFVLLFVIFPGIAFTERDHLGTVLFLPLLALMGWRAEAKSPAVPGIWLVVSAALCGSVLVLLKPYYVLAYIAPVLYVAWRRKNLMALIAPENCIIAVTGVAYIALIFWLNPEFIQIILPQVADVYMASGDSAQVALNYAPAYAAILLLLWLVAPGERMTPLVTVAILASLASLAALIYQGKGWAYHAFPAISLAFVAVLCRIAASPAWRLDRATLGRLGLCLLVLACSWRPFLETQKPSADFVTAVKAVSTATSRLGFIGSDMAGAHPLTRMVGTRFPSKNNADWFGSLAFSLSQQAAAEGDMAGAAKYIELSKAYLDEKYAEFVRFNYDLIVVEEDEPIWTDFVLGQPRFAALMSAYHIVAKDDRVAVYSRAYGKSDSPRAN
ncbi:MULTISPECIES: hypothetical protein [unclassified Rhizobium]|uniref:hypothetical protein n=1 Tax=unclassified Rhizobium TaxID=2613769 RepID=UPI001160A4E3|nr:MULTISPECIES: hypothetical protein [unclassified Rhizobium]TQX83434.1 hypothetical protein EQW76_26955 [Rhizobium sp. rho-13.1]TQY07039.1 hypothetical protein EQW74_25400 [Rhizobium sp. rho-1.1]